MLKVLVVDDSKIIRETLNKQLRWLGHEVVANASSGREAVDMYKEHRPDLVTMDITMPIMTGIEAVKEIKADFPEASIVMVTSHGEESLVMEAIMSGAKGYILKPITNKKISQTLSTVFPDLEVA